MEESTEQLNEKIKTKAMSVLSSYGYFYSGLALQARTAMTLTAEAMRQLCPSQPLSQESGKHNDKIFTIKVVSNGELSRISETRVVSGNTFHSILCPYPTGRNNCNV